MTKPDLKDILRKEKRISQLEKILPLQIWSLTHTHPANCNYVEMEKRIRELSQEYKILTGRHYVNHEQRGYSQR